MDKTQSSGPELDICIDDSRVTVSSRVGNIRRGPAAEARNLHSGGLAGYRLNSSGCMRAVVMRSKLEVAIRMMINPCRIPKLSPHQVFTFALDQKTDCLDAEPRLF
jgi:hypothetical protein